MMLTAERVLNACRNLRASKAALAGIAFKEALDSDKSTEMRSPAPDSPTPDYTIVGRSELTVDLKPSIHGQQVEFSLTETVTSQQLQGRGDVDALAAALVTALPNGTYWPDSTEHVLITNHRITAAPTARKADLGGSRVVVLGWAGYASEGA